MSEHNNVNYEFEQLLPTEIERKYLPLFPNRLLELRTQAMPIEQFYLSHPDEPFGLRLREQLIDGELHYTATLKNRGTVGTNGLERLEIETAVSPETYQYYKNANMPLIRKLRTITQEYVSIDFYDDGTILVESEHPDAWKQFIAEHGEHFVDITRDHQADNEWKAHVLYRMNHDGNEALQLLPELQSEIITHDILQRIAVRCPVIVQIAGRSGSGKSTIVRSLQEQLAQHGVETTVLSTDDYHRGGTWLRRYNNGGEWSKWDDPIVYDTKLMAENIRHLTDGKSIPRKFIDFSVGEPTIEGVINPAQVVIIEGIYATSADFAQFDTLQYAMPTPLATCIGRRLLRDLKERPQFSDPSNSLRYMLEDAEPMWRSQSFKAEDARQ